MTDYLIVQTTVSNKENADKIISVLLDMKLVACAQIYNIDSHYIWDNKIQHEPEIAITFKAKTKNYKAIEKIILENHTYDVPEIISFNINNGSKSYLDWISDVTN